MLEAKVPDDAARSANTVTASNSEDNISIVEATLEDAEAISRLGSETFSTTFGFSVSAEDLASFLGTTYSVDATLEILRDPKIKTFTARIPSDAQGAAADKLVGFVQLVRGSTQPCIPGSAAKHAELRRLYVDAHAHGQGIGTKLTAALEKEARAEGFEKIWLTVWEKHPRAQKLYQRLGYKRVGETGFRTGNEVQTDWVLMKTL
ncbi:acyl-CoA N-acyltransferase [Poronia punctata]|nr:acyl-CoA N-acyltransferase [Poronia punctata]